MDTSSVVGVHMSTHNFGFANTEGPKVDQSKDEGEDSTQKIEGEDQDTGIGVGLDQKA